MKTLSILFATVLLMGVSAVAQNYSVDVDQSVLKWNGKKVTGEHFGKISLKEGNFILDNNKITSGKFVIDMKTITCDDLEGEWNEKLVGHLKSDDFFGVDNHPTSVLVLKSSDKLKDGKTKVKADLTIKGITHPVEFDATIVNGKYTATVTVDRSLYNVRYGSGKFFDNLGDKTIYDNFTLNVEISASENTQASLR